MMKESESQIVGTAATSLRCGAWMLIVAGLVGMACVLPWHFGRSMRMEVRSDFRIHKSMREDYFTWGHVARNAAAHPVVLLLGDSAMWGPFVRHDETFSAALRRQCSSQNVVNLGLEGLHPIAMKTLVASAKSVFRKRDILLYFNPIWLNTRESDMQEAGTATSQHPVLLPQFSRDFPAYSAPLEKRLSRWMEQSLPVSRTLSHIRLSRYENKGLGAWMVESPRANPLMPLFQSISVAEPDAYRPDTRSWQERHLSVQDWQWLQPKESRQWACFLDIVISLKKQDNRVFVILGTINPHILTEPSRERLRELRQSATQRLQEMAVPFALASDLPENQYADASHPLAEGYAIMAKEICINPQFVEWMRTIDNIEPIR